MFPVKHAEMALRRAADWAGVPLSPVGVDRLLAYGDWLRDEAIPAGAVGPDEGPRIVDRHLADSLVFAAAWKDHPPETVVDVGSGVGLPGIPLAITHPEMTVTLLDRSQRRSDLARRAAHILGLTNVRTAWGDVHDHGKRYSGATFRAALSPEGAVSAARTLLETGGIAVIGLHRGDQPPQIVPDAEPGETLRVLKTPQGILDSAAWHLRMTAT